MKATFFLLLFAAAVFVSTGCAHRQRYRFYYVDCHGHPEDYSSHPRLYCDRPRR